MELAEVIKGRRSIRRFKEEKVERQTVTEILQNARWSPSGNNVQPWRFIVVSDEGKIERLAEASNQKWIGSSPLVLVCLADLKEYGQYASYSAFQPLVELGLIEDVDFGQFQERRERTTESDNRLANTINAFLNVAVIIDHITLLAHEAGLGTCWVRYFNVAMVREILEISTDYTVVALLPMGYPDESGRIKDRLESDSLILRWE